MPIRGDYRVQIQNHTTDDVYTSIYADGVRCDGLCIPRNSTRESYCSSWWRLKQVRKIPVVVVRCSLTSFAVESNAGPDQNLGNIEINFEVITGKQRVNQTHERGSDQKVTLLFQEGLYYVHESNGGASTRGNVKRCFRYEEIR